MNARVSAVPTRVGMTLNFTSRYPTQFSSGQRQRIAIANDPALLIEDEPVSALDTSYQRPSSVALFAIPLALEV